MCCAGCDQAYHTYCVGLDTIPDGTWYCPECSSDWQPPPGTEMVATVPRSHRPTRQSRRQASLLTSCWLHLCTTIFDHTATNAVYSCML